MSNPSPSPRLTAVSSVLVVIDVQDKLLAKVPAAAAVVRNAGFLLDCAGLLTVPALGTEQAPDKLGPTTGEIADRFIHPPRPKTAFSCCGAAGLLAELRDLGRPNVVLAGLETHVCVLHTTLDLIDAGFTVFLPVDAVAARFAPDHEAALRRLERAGAVPTTAETVAFEWLGGAGHPQFKAVSKLVVGRAAALG